MKKRSSSVPDLHEFNGLSLVDRARTVWDHGDHLADLDEPTKRYSYYRVGTFHAEVILERTDKLKMKDIIGFMDGSSYDRMTSVVDLGRNTRT
jgi:hypothetical protein